MKYVAFFRGVNVGGKNIVKMAALKALFESGYAIVYVTEALYAHLPKAADGATSSLPAVIPIPGITGNTGLGVARVRKFVERAVGSDILFNNQ